MVKIDKYDFPDDLYYTKDRTWAKIEADGKKARIGLDAFGVDLAGKLLFIRTRRSGSVLTQGGAFASIETGKWVGQLKSPVSGTVVEVNPILEKKPTAVNEDPYNQGWFMVIETTNLQAELKNLLKGEALVEFTKKDIAERGKKK
jgi:glycine cleavage system H protein